MDRREKAAMLATVSRSHEQVIPVLHVQDAVAAAKWYEQFDFELINVHRFEPALPAFATIASWRRHAVPEQAQR